MKQCPAAGALGLGPPFLSSDCASPSCEWAAASQAAPGAAELLFPLTGSGVRPRLFLQNGMQRGTGCPRQQQEECEVPVGTEEDGSGSRATELLSEHSG